MRAAQRWNKLTDVTDQPFAAAIKDADFFAVLVKVFFNSGDVNE
jgi:hypothetical protein